MNTAVKIKPFREVKPDIVSVKEFVKSLGFRFPKAEVSLTEIPPTLRIKQHCWLIVVTLREGEKWHSFPCLVADEIKPEGIEELLEYEKAIVNWSFENND